MRSGSDSACFCPSKPFLFLVLRGCTGPVNLAPQLMDILGMLSNLELLNIIEKSTLVKEHPNLLCDAFQFHEFAILIPASHAPIPLPILQSLLPSPSHLNLKIILLHHLGRHTPRRRGLVLIINTKAQRQDLLPSDGRITRKQALFRRINRVSKCTIRSDGESFRADVAGEGVDLFAGAVVVAEEEVGGCVG